MNTVMYSKVAFSIVTLINNNSNSSYLCRMSEMCLVIILFPKDRKAKLRRFVFPRQKGQIKTTDPSNFYLN